jgi:hypothetical protein
MKRSIAALAFACFVAPRDADAGAWVRPFGSIYLKGGLSWYSGAPVAGSAGVEGTEFDSATYDLYAELGLPLELQLIAHVPYVIATNQTPIGARFINHTLGDLRFELDRAIFQAPFPLAVGVEAKIPGYDPIREQNLPAEMSAFSSGSFPDVGDGNIDITPKLLAGWWWPEASAWFSAEVGWRARLRGHADGVAGSGGAGVFVIGQTLALGVHAQYFVRVESENLDRPSRGYLSTSGFVLLKSLGSWMPRVGLTLRGGAVIYEGSPAGREVSFGVIYER